MRAKEARRRRPMRRARANWEHQQSLDPKERGRDRGRGRVEVYTKERVGGSLHFVNQVLSVLTLYY